MAKKNFNEKIEQDKETIGDMLKNLITLRKRDEQVLAIKPEVSACAPCKEDKEFAETQTGKPLLERILKATGQSTLVTATKKVFTHKEDKAQTTTPKNRTDDLAQGQ